jgi:uncharacterized protein YfdQ (DUF2303 family)
MYDDDKNTDRENIAQTLARELPEAKQFAVTADDSMVHFALPPGHKLETVDLEKLRATPRQKAGAAVFNDVASFVAYLERHKTEHTVAWCAFNPQTFSLSFAAVIDDHATDEPGWRKHRATFQPDMSAEWKTWKGKNANAFAQGDFAIFIEDNAEDINAQGDGFPTDLQMLKMATDFVYNETRTLKSAVRNQSGGVNLNYIADPDSGTVETMKVFERFAIGIPVFQAGGAWGIHARLRYRVKDGKVSFFYELIRADRVHEQAAKALIEAVREGLGSVPLLMGAFA